MQASACLVDKERLLHNVLVIFFSSPSEIVLVTTMKKEYLHRFVSKSSPQIFWPQLTLLHWLNNGCKLGPTNQIRPLPYFAGCSQLPLP